MAVDSTDINIASDVNGLDVKVVNVPRVTVDVEYPKGTTDKTLPDKLNLIDVTKQVRAGNVTLPEGYEILDYKNGKVTLQKVNNSEVQIIFVDENNKQVKTDSLKNKNILETVSAREVTAPEGYTVIPDQNAVIASQTNGGVTSYAAIINVKKNAPTATHNGSNTSVKHGSHGGYVSQKVRVSFVDQDGDEVGYQQLNGKASFDTKISAPAGYSFVNANEANIKFDKSGNKDLKLKVTKNRPVSTMEEGIVTTNSGDFKHLYTIEGKDITNRGLSGDSKWYTDQYATINGEKMFRVATNEWVKATDVYK
ncbi:hypothetical protein [Companilactobacillus heilongjiangensis]|uniref:Surface layer protein A domain-containing protein n=1 Tax=Companilactobacillus heilongjiangensis TaxID=1074467 RepID=A0A0K2LFL7_9LACO|nr:hypothetical protein [Companilactobacillus heilongjiangensis]ALB30091.1 hypothetical protein JP39_12395 [Companilactobacillus heilongjiangensis]